MYISVNGVLLNQNSPCILPESQGFVYGYGLFETLKIHGGKILFFHEHLERLKSGCETLNIFMKYDENMIKNYCYELIRTNKLSFGAIKILYSKNNKDYDLIISNRDIKYEDELYEKGFYLGFTEIKRNPYTRLTYVKSNNYLENILAREEGIEKGDDEVIFLNVEGKICEGAISNIFFVKNEIIHTPSISCGLLPGIMREKIIELAKKLKLEMKVGQYSKVDLLNADEIFVTNSLMDIMPVSKLGNKTLDLKKNMVTQVLQSEFKRLYYL